jgi:hypothetical protein
VRLLAKIESVFNLRGRSVVVIPVRLSDLKVRVGDSVQVRAPDGQSWDTRIAGTELVKGEDGWAALLLTRDVEGDEIVMGTEIWLA